MGYPVDFEKGELNRGNWKRIKACMKKAEAGKTDQGWIPWWIHYTGKPVFHTRNMLRLSGL